MESRMDDTIPRVPISWGELLDKISILEIKVARLPTMEARTNTGKELAMLRGIAAPALAHPEAAPLAAQLKTLNEALWDIEDRIRDHERSGDFGEDFIALARSVYQTNDRRGAVKRQINLVLGSALIEEKGYKPY